jgi:hypothetical protein
MTIPIVERLRAVTASDLLWEGVSGDFDPAKIETFLRDCQEALSTLTAEKERADAAILNLRYAREGAVSASSLMPGSEKELNEAWDELQCCDDIQLDRGLASGIASLRYQRDQLIEWNSQNAVRAEQAEDRAEKAEAAREKAIEECLNLSHELAAAESLCRTSEAAREKAEAALRDALVKYESGDAYAAHSIIRAALGETP